MAEWCRHDLRAKNWIMLAFLVLAFSYLLYTSSIKNAGLYLWDYDTRCWYTAGTCWWNGESPHDAAIYTRTWIELFQKPPNNQATFVYPPMMALISVPLAVMPWPVAAWAFRGASILAFLGACYFVRRLMFVRLEKLAFLGSAGIYVGLTAFLGSVVQGVNQGQCALIVGCGCFATWYGYHRRILCLFLLGFLVASIKPQLSMIPLLYIFFLGGYRWFLYGVGLAVGFSVVTLILAPISNLFGSYQGSLDAHLQHQYFNQWNWYCGVPALLGSTPYGKFFALLGVVFGVLGAGWVAWRQQRVVDNLRNRLRHQQLIWIIAMTAMPIHIYDLVGQVFITITLWVLPDWRRRVVAFVCMYLGDKAYQVAARLEGLGEPIAAIGPLVEVQGTSIMGLMLMCLFFYWYWRDYYCANGPERVASG